MPRVFVLQRLISSGAKLLFYSLTDCGQSNLQFISYYNSPQAELPRVKWSVGEPKCSQLSLWSLWRQLTKTTVSMATSGERGRMWPVAADKKMSWFTSRSTDISHFPNFGQKYILWQTTPEPLETNVMIQTGNIGLWITLEHNVLPLTLSAFFVITANIS